MRRRLPPGAGLWLGLQLLAPSAAAAPAPSYDAVVIGAGVSGLAAAADLVKAGYSVVVLEGRDRIGGRVETVQTEVGLLDLGAQWIHGYGSRNPLYTMVQQQGWRTVKAGNDEEAFRYAGNGSAIPSATTDAWYSIYQDLMAKVDDGDYSVGDTLASAVDSFASDSGLDAAARFGLQCQLATNVVQEYAADPSQLSAANFDAGADDPSDEDAILADGYDQVPKYLASLVGADNIRTGHRVSHVSYDVAANTAAVSAVDASGNAATFTASFAVVTVPLGVLKAQPPRANALSFSPALPASKATAIERLGMGTLDKIFLDFDRPFWDQEAWVTCCGTFPHGPQFEFYALNYPLPGRSTLVAFTAGSAAVDREKLSDQDLVTGALTALNQLYGAQAATAVLRYSKVTRWSEDNFTYGSYSYHAVGSQGLTDRRALFAPVSPVLYFGGEATNDQYPSTVHGAFLSGKAAAKAAIADNALRAPLVL